MPRMVRDLSGVSLCNLSVLCGVVLLGIHQPQRTQVAEECDARAQLPFNIASRLALNSDPAFHSGYLSPCATRYPIIVSNCASSTAPVRSQSGFTSSETLW